MVASAKTYELFGLSLDSPWPDLESLMKLTHPEDCGETDPL